MVAYLLAGAAGVWKGFHQPGLWILLPILYAVCIVSGILGCLAAFRNNARSFGYHSFWPMVVTAVYIGTQRYLISFPSRLGYPVYVYLYGKPGKEYLKVGIDLVALAILVAVWYVRRINLEKYVLRHYKAIHSRHT